MEFQPLTIPERDELIKSLRNNVEGAAILTNRRDTSFVGGVDHLPDDEVIQAVKSVPCHY